MEKYKSSLGVIKNLLLVFTILILPVIIDGLSNEKVQFNLVAVLLLVGIIYVIYKDFNDKAHTTTIFIRIIDIAILIFYVLIVLDTYDIIDIDSFIKSKKIIFNRSFSIWIFLRIFLKGDMFLRKSKK